jgi:hypothetical protein
VKGNHTPGGFSPNLHRDTGKVCLSLLGTWEGLGWEAGKSNIYQVLSTILIMILGAKQPYYMEPDFGGWEGDVLPAIEKSPRRRAEVLAYHEEIQYHTAKLAILNMLKKPIVEFERVIRNHLSLKRDFILATLAAWKQRGTASFKARLDPVINEIYDIYFNDAPLSDLEALLNEKLTSLRYIRMRLAEMQCVTDSYNPYIKDESTEETRTYLIAQIDAGKALLEIDEDSICKIHYLFYKRSPNFNPEDIRKIAGPAELHSKETTKANKNEDLNDEEFDD